MMPRLGPLDVEVGRLDELEQDVLDVLADVAGLGQRRGVGDGEGHVQDAGERLGQQRLAAARRPEQQDVRLLQLDLAVGRRSSPGCACSGCRPPRRGCSWPRPGRSRSRSGWSSISRGLGSVSRSSVGRHGQLFVDDLVAEIDALVTDVHARAGDELLDLALRLAAEAAQQLVVAVDTVLSTQRIPPGPTDAR